MTRIKPLNAALAAALVAGSSVVSLSSHAWNAGPPKYLIVWTSDQYMDGRNQSPLDGILGLPAGALPDADFLAVIDANPISPTYGHVVNTAEMPAVYGQHLLSVTENFVDNALGALGLPNHGVLDDDILGGVPNFNSATNGLPPVVPAPSSVLNEAHHHSVVPTVQPDGKITAYYGGLISANVFGCDISDPMSIHPAPHSTLENIPLHASATQNLCGLTVSGAVHGNLTGTDDLEWNPVNGHYYTTMMGAGGNRGNFGGGSGSVPVSLPPVLTTPGGIQELDPFTGTVVGEYGAVPQHAVPGHGKYVNGADMLGPKRYAPRTQVVFGGVDGNGDCTGQPLCLPGVARLPTRSGTTAGRWIWTVASDDFAERRPAAASAWHRAAPLDHRHQGQQERQKNGATKGGGLMTSDYADPVSLAIAGFRLGPRDLGAGSRHDGAVLGRRSPGRRSLLAVAQVPDRCPRHEDNRSTRSREGLMAMRVTHNHGHKGMFVASMCGGALYYSPDITVMNAKSHAGVRLRRLRRHLGVHDHAGQQVHHDADLGHPAHRVIRSSDQQLKGRAQLRAWPCSTSRRCSARATAWDSDSQPRPRPLEQHGCRPAARPEGDGRPVRHHLPQPRTTCITAACSGPTTAEMAIVISWSTRSNFERPPARTVSTGGADDHPDSVHGRGGPHFVVHDGFDRYVATSLYFVDLPRVRHQGRGQPADRARPGSRLAHGQCAHGTPDSSPPGRSPIRATHHAGGLGAAFQLHDDNNLLPFKTGGWASFSRADSVGDDTVSMMRWTRWTGNLELDRQLQHQRPELTCRLPTTWTSAMRASGWQANGTRAVNAGDAEPHGMSFYTVGSLPLSLTSRRDRPRHQLHAGTGIGVGGEQLTRSVVVGFARAAPVDLRRGNREPGRERRVFFFVMIPTHASQSRIAMDDRPRGRCRLFGGRGRGSESCRRRTRALLPIRNRSRHTSTRRTKRSTSVRCIPRSFPTNPAPARSARWPSGAGAPSRRATRERRSRKADGCESRRRSWRIFSSGSRA